MGMMVAGLLVLFGTIVISSLYVVHNHNHKKVLVGTAGMVATVILDISPLSVIGLVIQTKSVEFMPSLSFSLFTFLGSLLWMVYGAISRDIIIMAPNFVGVPLGFAQMVLHCVYRPKMSSLVEAEKVDAVKEMESIKQNAEEDIKEYIEDIRIQVSA